MSKLNNLALPVAVGALGIALSFSPALAETAEKAAVTMDAQYVFNTLLFLIGGFLVMWMAAGFAMLEAGLVRSKNVSMQCTKNIALFAIAGLMFWVTGYNLMYEGVDGGFMGSFGPKDIPAPDKDAGSYSASSDWFFQMVFCATTASIVSGTLAERIKIWPFLIFTALLTGFIYPIEGAWKWGYGWLYPATPEGFDSWADAVKAGKDAIGIVKITGGHVFQDFAGSTLVHSAGGWAALAGALILGARAGKYGKDGRVNPMPGSSMPLATLGTFILWLGWFGFNGASQLAMGTISDAASVSRIFVNTNLAAAAGVMVALTLTQILYKKIDITMVLNGALAGLVSITAEPLAPSVWQTLVVGGIGGAIVVFVVPLLDKLKIDDVVGAIPVHLVAGIWGTLIVPWSNSDSSIFGQIIGIVSIGAFVFISSSIIWLALKVTIGIRATPEQESLGLDVSEIGVEAYPEFSKGGSAI